jgi:hypothetical protein
MQSGAWITLLKRIPPAQHNILTLKTLCGTEINLQNILLLEPEYAVIRGRLAATTETGRVYFIPYDQINYVGFAKEIKEDQVRDLFGAPLLGEVAKQAAATARADSAEEAPTTETDTGDAPEAQPSSPGKPEASGGDAAKPVERFSGKEAILQRLRARTLATTKPRHDQ